MEKEIAWTAVAENDLREIVSYLKAEWPGSVLNRFEQAFLQKISLLKKHPTLGFRSRKYSRFRKTTITRYYMLVYSISKSHIVIHRLKHTKMK